MPQRTGEISRSKLAGKPERRKGPTASARKKATRPRLKEIPPLFSTYGAPKAKRARFIKARGDRAVRWIESHCVQFKGRFKGQPLYLLAWERRAVREIFGWIRADGTRLYRTVYLEVPRKSGKTTLIAAINLYLAFGEDEGGPELVWAAYDRDQATVGWNDCRHMIEASPELFEEAAIYISRKEIVLRNNPGGSIKPVSRENRKLFGLNLHGIVMDEAMTLPDRELFDALSTSTGARVQPLTVLITSAGWNRHSLAFEFREHTRKIAEGVEVDHEFLGVVYGVDEEADWTVPANWKAANPSLGWTVPLEYYRQKAQEAKQMPSAQNAFRTLLLGQWVGSETRWLDLFEWDACNALVDPDLLRGKEAYAGLDLSSTTDMSALVLFFPEDGSVLPFFFLPTDGLRERGHRDHLPYELWAKQGHLLTTPGNSIDYAFIRAKILELTQESKFKVNEVVYDRWGATQLVQELQEDGVNVVPMGQGFASMSAPTKELMRKVLAREIHHGGHPVLRSHADSMVVKTDPAGNVKADKSKARSRIDGMVGLIMAIDASMRRTTPSTSVYEQPVAVTV